MKNDVVMYQKVYQILKNKIESGLISDGEGLIETKQRKRAVVTANQEAERDKVLLPLKKLDADAVKDVFEMAEENYLMARCIPQMVYSDSMSRRHEIHRQ